MKTLTMGCLWIYGCREDKILCLKAKNSSHFTTITKPSKLYSLDRLQNASLFWMFGYQCSLTQVD